MTKSPYEFKIMDIDRIIKTSRRIGLLISESDNSYPYTYLCIDWRGQPNDGPDWTCLLLGLVLTRCHGRDTFERVTAGYIELTCKHGSPEPFHSNEPEPVQGRRKGNIRLV